MALCCGYILHQRAGRTIRTSIMTHLIPLLLPFALLFIPRNINSDDRPTGADSRWNLVWSDEFDTPGEPDRKKWGYDLGGNGWGNNELQNYTDHRTNSRIEGGRLIIEAHKESLDKSAYTSARLVSKGKGEWQEGRIEVRAKLPAGRGTWPAIWLLPAVDKLSWPDDGEIDVMEHVGFDPGIVHASIHTKKYNHLAGTQKTATTKVADCSTTFHVYSIEWSGDRIEIFVDDTKYFKYARESGARSDTWPFDKK